MNKMVIIVVVLIIIYKTFRLHDALQYQNKLSENDHVNS